MWRAFLGRLDARGRLRWEHVFIDGSFASAKKGPLTSEKPSGARARSGWWWSTARVFLWEYMSPPPALGSHARRADAENDSGPRAGRGRPRQNPDRLIGDRGYDSDPLRERLGRRGITVIVPYRDNRQVRRYEDGRHLRRYRHRWNHRAHVCLARKFSSVAHSARTDHVDVLLVYLFAAALIALRRF
jgi:hypothetical protein